MSTNWGVAPLVVTNVEAIYTGEGEGGLPGRGRGRRDASWPVTSFDVVRRGAERHADPSLGSSGDAVGHDSVDADGRARGGRPKMLTRRK
jgi:hypothetical protein